MKNQMTQTTVFLFLCFIFGSCKNEVKESAPTTIDLTGLKIDEIIIDSLITKGDIINFEQEDVIISSGSEIIDANNTGIFILDKWMNKQVLMFDSNGRFIHTIGKIGNGPGEYSRLYDAIVHDNKIEILSSSDHSQIQEYSLDGDYISTKEFPISPSYSFCFNSNPDKYMFSVSNNPNSEGRLVIYDKNTKEKQYYFKPNKDLPPSEVNAFTTNESGTIFYWEALGDSFYQIEDNEIKKVMHFNWKKGKAISELEMKDFSKIMEKEEVYMIKNIIIHDDYKLFSFVKLKPGSQPKILNLLLTNKGIHSFIIKNNVNFNLSPPQLINKNNQILFLVEPQNEDFIKEQKYQHIGKYMFALKIDIEYLIESTSIQ